MKAVMLHVLGPEWNGRTQRRTFVIREDDNGDVDIVEDMRPRCDADRSVAIGGDRVLEVERVDARTV